MRDLSKVKAIIFDLDGCIYLGESLIPGADEAISRIRRANRKVFYMTNNASRTPVFFMRKLNRLGVEAKLTEILTSGTATASFLALRFGSSKIFPVGGRPLATELKKCGHRILDGEKANEADFVVACLDPTFNYKKLSHACRAIDAGAKFYATNIDPRLPLESGFMPGAGAIVSAIASVTGKQPFVVGKPSPHMTRIALARLGIKPSDAMVVGDRLDTDIQSGTAARTYTSLVLSGSTKRRDLRRNLQPKPDLIINDISELPERLRI